MMITVNPNYSKSPFIVIVDGDTTYTNYPYGDSVPEPKESGIYEIDHCTILYELKKTHNITKVALSVEYNILAEVQDVPLHNLPVCKIFEGDGQRHHSPEELWARYMAFPMLPVVTRPLFNITLT